MLQNIILDNIVISLCVIVIALSLSYLYIYCTKRHYCHTQGEQMECSEVEIAEPKYIPIYIAYFVIAVSIDSWFIFSVVFVVIYLLILFGKFSYFNPYLLFFGYHFYEVAIKPNDCYAKCKVFLLSKEKIKHIKAQSNLIRLNDFTFLDKGDENG